MPTQERLSVVAMPVDSVVANQNNMMQNERIYPNAMHCSRYSFTYIHSLPARPQGGFWGLRPSARH